MNTISSTLLWDVLIGVTNLTRKLDSRDVLELSGNSNSLYLPVKKDKDEKTTSIIDDLKEIISICNKTKPSKSKNETVFLLIGLCENAVKNLSKNYPRKKRFVNKNDLEDHEREELLDSLAGYLDDLGELLYENTEIILNLEPKQNLDVNKKSLKILDKSAKGDLEEGLTLLHSGHTTAAYMILMRVAEFLVQQYYKKITGTLPKDIDSAWGQMLFSLQSEYKSKIDKTFQNLLYFLKDKRNEAQHPGKRFDEKDCNKLITYLTEFIDYFVKNKSS